MSERTTGSPAPQPDGAGPEDLEAFERLLVFLREARGFDFTGYKRPSLVRRVRHRMGELGIATFEEYQDVLSLRPDEFTTLFNTILINVTGFFRDPEAWTAMRDVVVPSLVDASDGAPVRIWSAGCASGQEAYSMAMVLHDRLGADFRERVKIYATDVDDQALEQARQASYPERATADVPEPFRERYFESVNGRRVITNELRRNVIFGRNDLTVDAPISRIDVLLCRNTLMYFNAETQSRVLNRLGFALRPDGVLFLGRAEMLLNHSDVFQAVDLKRRFFRKIRLDVSEGGLRPRGLAEEPGRRGRQRRPAPQRDPAEQPRAPDRRGRRRSAGHGQPPRERDARALRARPGPPVPGPRDLLPPRRAAVPPARGDREPRLRLAP